MSKLKCQRAETNVEMATGDTIAIAERGKRMRCASGIVTLSIVGCGKPFEGLQGLRKGVSCSIRTHRHPEHLGKHNSPGGKLME